MGVDWPPMTTPNQIILSWSVSCAGSTRSPAQVAAALGAVALYQSADNDPILGQLFGLTVASDVTVQTPGGTPTGATRTLTLNMTAAVGSPTAPPPFPCRPTAPTPPTPPYEFTALVPLTGEYSPINGQTSVPADRTQVPVLPNGSVIQFDSQPGVSYTVSSPTSSGITISPMFSGATGATGASQVVSAPVTTATSALLHGTFGVTHGSPVVPTSQSQVGAVVSTSLVQFAEQPGVTYEVSGVGPTGIVLATPYTGTTAGATTSTLVTPAADTNAAVYSSSPLDSADGVGAQAVTISYVDSLGSSGTTVVALAGATPVMVVLAPNTVDIAQVTAMAVDGVGLFGNSVGQITLSATTAPVTPDLDQDEAQMLLSTPLVYLPPSYFAVAQQAAATPALAGDFYPSVGETHVGTDVDQTGALTGGDVVTFASDGNQYTIRSVSTEFVELTTPYTGISAYNDQVGVNTSETGATAASLASNAGAAPPTDAQLAACMAQYVNPGTAVPPPFPPDQPATMSPAPVLLSGMFTQTLYLALATPVTPLAIAFA